MYSMKFTRGLVLKIKVGYNDSDRFISRYIDVFR